MSNISNILNDIQKVLESIDKSSADTIAEFTAIADNKVSYYQLFINVLFIVIVVGILYVLYRDYIYRNANIMTRCTDIIDIINMNINDNDNSYTYIIYIVHVNNINNIVKDHIVKLEYNFIAEETKISFGEHKIVSPVLFSPSDNVGKISNAYYVFDLAEKKKRFIDYYDKDSGKVFYLDRKKMATKKYKYYITSSLDEKLTDKSSIQLANFVKRYGYNDSISIDPIYSILYAIESKKNMEY